MDPDAIRHREAERLRRAAAGALEGSGERRGARSIDGGLIALLENVRSLWNVGSIFRSADGAGIGRLVLTGITGTPPRREIEKTALGADQAVAWRQCVDPLAAALDERRAGFRLIALETGGQSVTIDQVDGTQPLCLMVGHEVAGLSPRLLEIADLRVALPMRGVKESLNVAVAFGIAAFALRAARDAAHPPGDDDPRHSIDSP